MFFAENPLGYVRQCISRAIASKLGIPAERLDNAFDIPREEYGDISIVLPKAGIEQRYGVAVAEAVRDCNAVADAKALGVYVNIFIDRQTLTELLFHSVARLRDRYGVVGGEEKKRIVVEFVSANPLHPLHIGAARNAALGQFIANILRLFGHEVQTRFYINDVGRQVAVLALGIMQLPEIEPPQIIKPDHWVGLLYAVTNTVIEIQNLKQMLEKSRDESERKEILEKLDEALADAARLREQAPELFEIISEKLKNKDVEQEISNIMRKYEVGDPEISKVIRRIVTLCIEGFRSTLKRFGVDIEQWDWESDLIWSGEVEKVVRALEATQYIINHKGALAVDVGRVAQDPAIREMLGIDRDLEIPPLIVRRSDGTTLYTVRDIAYTLKKFREFQADKVINVIASEQKLPQAQLKLALYLLGYKREAENLVHYSYEIVTLEGQRMSSRRGRLISLDEMLDTAKVSALAELEKRGTKSEELAEKIGVAAMKFYLLLASPSKPLRFSLEHALDFEKNSAPYLLYTYARTTGVFRKAAEHGVETDIDRLLKEADTAFAVNQKRWRLVKLLSMFPDRMYSAYRSLDPSILVTYALHLADEFNSWYDEEPILLEKDRGTRASKLMLTYGVKVVIGNVLKVLGIEPLERI